jgi:chaperonin GroEL (HSP60 family)
MNPMDLKRGVDMAVDAVVKTFKALEIDKRRDRAGRHHLINGDTEIGRMLAEP